MDNSYVVKGFYVVRLLPFYFVIPFRLSIMKRKKHVMWKL